MSNAIASGSLVVDKEGLNELLNRFLDIRSKVDTCIQSIIQRINRVVEADNWPDIQDGSFATAKILEGNREAISGKEESIKSAINGVLGHLQQSENQVASKFQALLDSYPQEQAEGKDTLTKSNDQGSNIDLKELAEHKIDSKLKGNLSDEEQRKRQFEIEAKTKYREYVDAIKKEGGNPIPYEDYKDLLVDCGELKRPYIGYVTKREKEASEYFKQLEEHRKAQANTPKIVEIANAIKDIFKETFGLKSNAISNKAYNSNTTGNVFTKMGSNMSSSNQYSSSILSAFKLK